METKNIILITLFIITLAIVCYVYFTDFGHTNLYDNYDLFYGDKALYIGPENMPISEESLKYSFSIWLRTNNLYSNYTWNNDTDIPKTIIDNNGSPNIVYLLKDNTIRIQMAYYGNKNTIEYYNIDLDEFESQKWINLVITVNNKRVNVFKNGELVSSKKLLNPNLKNYKPMSIGEKFNNFNGYIGRIDYYNYELSSNKINSLYHKYLNYHPNTLMSYENYEYLKKDDEENKINIDKYKNFFV
jgi:hypothetical protein